MRENIKIGDTYKVCYEAKNFQPGLKNIVALIISPDEKVVGVTNNFREIDGTGIYCYDFATGGLKEGIWILRIREEIDKPPVTSCIFNLYK